MLKKINFISLDREEERLYICKKYLNPKLMKTNSIIVKEVVIRTIVKDSIDYICITDIARQKNIIEPKDVVKNWMRQKNTLEYLGLWEKLNNPMFKGFEFDPLLRDAGSNSFTMSPSRWVELTDEEADVLNVAMFGMTAKEWRDNNPDLKGNIRDYASINELICLSNMENINAVLINEGVSQSERLERLNKIAIHQMKILEDNNNRKLLK